MKELFDNISEYVCCYQRVCDYIKSHNYSVDVGDIFLYIRASGGSNDKELLDTYEHCGDDLRKMIELDSIIPYKCAMMENICLKWRDGADQMNHGIVDELCILEFQHMRELVKLYLTKW